MAKNTKLPRHIVPMNLTADWTGGNPIEASSEDVAKKPIRNLLRLKARTQVDETNRGTAGDLDDINANKHPRGRKLG